MMRRLSEGIHKAFAWATSRVDGFRGGFLLLTAVGHIPLGVSWITTSTPRREAAFSWLPGNVDGDELGWAWLIAGLIALIAAVMGKSDSRWTTLGYMAAFVPATVWAVIFTVGAFMGLTDTSWAFALRYGFEGMVYLLVAGWPNPPKVPKWTDRLGSDGPASRGGDGV